MVTSQFTDAGAPFDNPNADVVLRSADNVDFRTFKLILSLASPIFDDMFGMIQPSSESSINEMKDGAPVVSVSESTVTLKRLLEFCHPNCVPVLDNLEVISGILAAAEKYDMDAVLKRAGATLVTTKFLEEQPVRAFALACQYKLEQEARILAKATLSLPLPHLIHEGKFGHISEETREQVRAYRRNCRKAVRKLTTRFDWLEPDREAIWDACISNPEYGWIRMKFKDRKDRKQPTPQWWTQYVPEAAATLARQPVGGKELGSDLMEWVETVTNGCRGCSKDALRDIHRFNQIFSEEVERVVSRVELQITF
jgi:hypothetical protein